MTKTMYSSIVRRIACAGLCLALCLLLPFLTGQIPSVGSMLCPMHLPVLICGFICGWEFGLAVGFIAPLLRYVLFGMPPIFPTGLAMAFELAAYGVLTGLLYRAFGKTVKGVYPALILAMLGGRLVWGLVRWALALITGVDFTAAMFLSGAVLTAIPGIITHLVLVPLVVVSLKRAGYSEL